MSMDDREFNSIVEEALALDTVHRSELVEKLIESLPREDRFMDEWLDECEHRMKQLKNGEAKTYPAEVVIQEARVRIGSRK
jgi:hypothetical protein